MGSKLGTRWSCALAEGLEGFLWNIEGKSEEGCDIPLLAKSARSGGTLSLVSRLWTLGEQNKTSRTLLESQDVC